MGHNKTYIDHPYGAAKRQALDFYLPDNKRKETGLIVFIHGGGWTTGNKDYYRNDLKAWSEKGYAAAAVNYRFASETVRINDMMDDITAALSTVRDLAQKQGVTLRKCLLTGSSAGGHLALLYAYSKKETAPVTPACVVDFCGPADLSDPAFALNEGYSPWIQTVLSYCCGCSFTEDHFADAAPRLEKISPVTYAAGAVPTVMAYGEADDIVPFSQAETLDRALTQYGIAHDLVIYAHSWHDLAADPDADAQTKTIFAKYAETYLK